MWFTLYHLQKFDQSAPNFVKMQNVCDHKISDEFAYGDNQNQNCQLSALESENLP